MAMQEQNTFNLLKNHPLGHGSYGTVYKAKCDQLPCAAKVLHPTILDPADPGSGKIMDRFQQECGFLERIRHPNIVQYLNMTRDPESGLPVLLMELLDESLTKMLERSQQSLTSLLCSSGYQL
ncbi:MAG: protein kinase [Proteobacteria bacterium]|nr:protein kinase [Pseudomonadota bacterium]